MTHDESSGEAMATRVGLFSAFRRTGRAAKGAALLATAPARVLSQNTIDGRVRPRDGGSSSASRLNARVEVPKRSC